LSNFRKRIKYALVILAILSASLALYFVLSSKHALILHPKGPIARGELELIKTNTLLMLIVIVPTLLTLFLTVWKYRAKNKKAKYEPEGTSKVFQEVILWVIPSAVIAVMAVTTWKATYKLDPYKPIDSDIKPLEIQVVALNWKWLFIYPEQGIATVNFVQFPARVPIHFTLAADGSPMNSFWLPQMSGQIYAMTGMVTPLHIMADEPGVYTGRASEINGEGYANMTFIAKSTAGPDFEDWVARVKESPLLLNGAIYNDLLKPSQKHPITLYSYVEKDLFHNIVMKYMMH